MPITSEGMTYLLSHRELLRRVLITHFPLEKLRLQLPYLLQIKHRLLISDNRFIVRSPTNFRFLGRCFFTVTSVNLSNWNKHFVCCINSCIFILFYVSKKPSLTYIIIWCPYRSYVFYANRIRSPPRLITNNTFFIG